MTAFLRQTFQHMIRKVSLQLIQNPNLILLNLS